MAQKIDPQPGIMEIALYKGGASHLAGRTDVLKLSSNENPYGPSPAAIEAFREAAARMHLYPPTDHAGLRTAIGRVHGIDPEGVICGVGSDELINLICFAYAGPGTEVIQTEHGFAMYRIGAQAAGATPVSVPERDRRVDVDAILDRAGPETRIVFVTNPGNPTGTLVPETELQRLAEGLPDQCLLVLDGAYVEFAGAYDGGARLVEARENVMMLRTFSKAYGLGGLRVGWGYGPQHVIDVLNRIRGPFNLGAPQLAAAEAALGDRAFVERTVSENARLRDWLRGRLEAAGIAADESHANYLLARFASTEEADAAEARLREDGILVRKVGGYGLPDALRITVGDEAGCRRVAASLEAFRGVPA